MSKSVQTRTIDVEHAGRRLDNYLMSVLKNIPKSYVYRIIRSGEVRVNGGRRKAHTRLEVDDKVRIPPYREPTRENPVISSKWCDSARKRVLYEDTDLLVFDKPAGIAVHGGSGLDFGVIDVLHQTFGSHLELVHRLDKDTSGCLLVAKSPPIGRALQQLFRDGKVSKRYRCLVKGHFPRRELSCDARLKTQRNDVGQAKTQVDPHGKRARTVFRRLDNYDSHNFTCAHLEVEIETGRTHQIRVHAAYLEHPIAGDVRYGDQSFNQGLKSLGLSRMYLHAVNLAFRHPTQKRWIRVPAPEAPELAELLSKLTLRRS